VVRSLTARLSEDLCRRVLDLYLEDDVKRLLGPTILFPALVAGMLLGCILNPQPAPTARPSPTAATVPGTLPPATPTAAPATPTVEPRSTVASEATFVAPPFDWANLAPYQSAMRPEFAADVDQFVDATRYWIDLYVDVDRRTLSGVEQVRYTNHETESLTEIVFRLLPGTPGYGGSMTVSSVTVDGITTSPALTTGGSALYVPLVSPLLPGESIELGLRFEGAFPSDAADTDPPLAGYAQYGYIDRVLALPNAYPMIPVYDDEGWNVELAATFGDATFTDTSLYLVRITLPVDMVLATSGVTLDRRDNGDGTATCLCASGPMRDFGLVASADYGTVSTKVGKVLVTAYILPGDREGGERVLDYAAQSLRIYEQILGPYPYTELDVMATPTKAGGIEYPGLIVVAARLYTQVGGFFEWATVHEVAHQWWYSLVGNDQLDEPWLDEALTQYTSLLYVEHRYGEEAAQKALENVFQEPYRHVLENEQDMPVGLPVAAYPQDLYGSVVYGKGPLFFHAMRQQVGDETFYRILSSYLEEYRYGVAYPQDLLSVAERVSGQELDALYERWILGK